MVGLRSNVLLFHKHVPIISYVCRLPMVKLTSASHNIVNDTEFQMAIPNVCNTESYGGSKPLWGWLHLSVAVDMSIMTTCVSVSRCTVAS